jgi:hypothetical protein
MIDHDDLDVEIQDFTAEEICELLAESDADLSPEQAAELARFVEAAGSIEAAIQALGQATEH